jgi:hypothetical protein
MLTALGCTSTLPSHAVTAQLEEGAIYSSEEGKVMLRQELSDFEEYLESTMKSSLILLRARETPEKDLKTLSKWQEAQLKKFRAALHQEDPVVALIDAWAVGKTLGHYLKTNQVNEELPSSVRDVALDMLKRREDRLSYIATRYLNTDAVANIRAELDAFTTQQVAGDENQPSKSDQIFGVPMFSAWVNKGRSAVGGILSVPLMPGRALKGVSESGKALSGIRETTADAVQVASELPEKLRVEFQHALTEVLEKREEILTILNAIDSASTNLSTTAQSTLQTATEVQKSLHLAKEVLPAGESFAAAVEKAVSASTELIRALEKSNSTDSESNSESLDIKDVKATADSLTGAANEVNQVLEHIQALIERHDRTDPGENTFEIKDYTRAAESIEKGASELRGLLSDLQNISADNTLGDSAIDTSKQLIDHATKRIVLVMVILFGLAAAWLLLRQRLSRPAEKPLT